MFVRFEEYIPSKGRLRDFDVEVSDDCWCYSRAILACKFRFICEDIQNTLTLFGICRPDKYICLAESIGLRDRPRKTVQNLILRFDIDRALQKAQDQRREEI